MTVLESLDVFPYHVRHKGTLLPRENGRMGDKSRCPLECPARWEMRQEGLLDADTFYAPKDVREKVSTRLFLSVMAETVWGRGTMHAAW